jgi:hypothetical protein
METPLEDVGVEVRILLKWISQELYKFGRDISGSVQKRVANSVINLLLQFLHWLRSVAILRLINI